MNANDNHQTPEIQTFDFNGITLRTVMIDNEPWFVAREACDVLGIANVTHGIANIDKTNVYDFRFPGAQGRANKMVNEAGLYALVMRSNKPNAKSFQDWVTGTVLPAIRKDGGYVAGEEFVATGEMSEDERSLLQIQTPGPFP